MSEPYLITSNGYFLMLITYQPRNRRPRNKKPLKATAIKGFINHT